jgi:hypothetical protein
MEAGLYTEASLYPGARWVPHAARGADRLTGR